MSVVTGGSDTAWDQPMSNESVCSQVFLSATLKRDWPHCIVSLPRVLQCSNLDLADRCYAHTLFKYIKRNMEKTSSVCSHPGLTRQSCGVVLHHQHVSTCFKGLFITIKVYCEKTNHPFSIIALSELPLYLVGWRTCRDRKTFRQAI